MTKLTDKNDEEKQDRAFLIDIIFQIKRYAEENDMDTDDTINTIAANMLSLLEVSTFNAGNRK